MSIKNIKSTVIAWKNGIYTPEMALRRLLKELRMEVSENDTKRKES